mgnify:CR=1 FL=1
MFPADFPIFDQPRDSFPCTFGENFSTENSVFPVSLLQVDFLPKKLLVSLAKKMAHFGVSADGCLVSFPISAALELIRRDVVGR